MLPSLPDEIIERVLLHAYEADDDLTSNLEAWCLVCKQWQQVVEPLNWANQVRKSRFFKLPAKRLVKYINSVQIRDVHQGWLDKNLPHLGPFLLSLDLVAVDLPAEAWSALRPLVNVERLGVSCTAKKPGDLHGILDILRFFPRLEQLVLRYFNAAPVPTARKSKQRQKKAERQSAAYTVAGTLTTLTLASIGGSRPLDLLRTAFDPSFVLTVSSLVLSNLGNTLTHALIDLFHSTLRSLSFDLSTGKGSSFDTLLPQCPLYLDSFTLELPETPLDDFLKQCHRLSCTLISYPCNTHLRVGDFRLIISSSWREVPAKATLSEWCKVITHMRTLEGIQHIGDNLLALLHHDDRSAALRVGYVGSGFLSSVMNPKSCSYRYSRKTTLDFPVVEEVLEKGRRLREELAQKDAAVEAVPLDED